MFTKKVNSANEKKGSDGVRPRRGRPEGTTPQGLEARRRLYEAAIDLIGKRGYEAATLREVAGTVGVSAGLLYKYFPSKQAVVLEFYDELSAEYAARAEALAEGKWRNRFALAMKICLEVLGPHRRTLISLAPVLVGDSENGLFAAHTAFSRKRIEQVFLNVVRVASDAPAPGVAESLGRLLYLLHLSVILWWLLDKSPAQRATHALIALLERILASFSVALMLPQVRGFVRTADSLVKEALFGV